jgi:hypothetical protein
MEYVAELYQNLQKLIGFHRQLLELVRAEKTAIVEANLKAIQEALSRKQVIIELIGREESNRSSITAKLAIFFKKPLNQVSLNQLIILIQAIDIKKADSFRSAKQALVLLAERIQEQSNENLAVLEKSIGHISKMKQNVLGEGVPKSETYTPYGQRSSPVHGARLISKEA